MNSTLARYCPFCRAGLETSHTIGGDTDNPLPSMATGIYQRDDGGACIAVEETQATVYVHEEGEGS